jgi:hypothetical protein
MPTPTPKSDELEIGEWLNADMTRDDLIDILQHLRFEKGFSVVRLDRHVRDYLVTSIKSR